MENKVVNDIKHPAIADDPLPEALDTEDKQRIIKGVILMFLFASVVVSSVVYYNAPNYNPNLVFEGTHNEDVKHDRHILDNPIYRLNYRYSSKNCKIIF
jgi:hypothetical protein